MTEEINKISEAYASAECSLPFCKDGDSIEVKSADLKIKFYNRKGRKLFSITKPREVECQVALIQL